MPRWAKLSERVGQDGRLCELAEQAPLAALLFTWSLPAADLYGIIPGSPREYHARVAGAMRLTEKQVGEAIDAQVRAGLIERYENSGKLLLYLRNYHRYQDLRWDRTGPPEHGLPPDWHIPDKLREILGESGTNKRPEDYGLHAMSTGLCVELPEPPGDSRLDTDVDADVDADVETALVLLTPPAPPARREEKAAKKAGKTKEQASMEIDLLLSNENPVEATVIREVLERLAISPKDGARTPLGQLSRVYEMLGQREKYGRDAWLHGMRKAAAKEGLRDLNYVAVIAANYQPGDEMRGSSGSASRLAIDEEQAVLDRGKAATETL